jgi:hypothetical protein
MTKAVLTSLLCLVFITSATCQISFAEKVAKTLSKQVLIEITKELVK